MRGDALRKLIQHVVAGQERYKKKAVVKRPSDADITAPRSQVLMIFRPAGRFLTILFPPRPFAARFLAAVILPPLLFFAIGNLFCCYVLMFIVAQHTLRNGLARVYGV